MAEHRFGELPVGATFLWRGNSHVKISPLLARMEGDSEQVLVPRSARVTLLASDPPTAPAPAAGPPSAGALEQLHQDLVQLIRDLPLEPSQIQATLAEVQRLFRSLNNHP
jgi:hypothetical protein